MMQHKWMVVCLLLLFFCTRYSASAPASTSSSGVSYYDLLEVQADASTKDIKKSYRRLALLHHPDKATTAHDRKDKEEIFVNLANAYEVLASDILRPRYDYLVSQQIYVYDDRIRDWSTFDPVTRTFNAETHTVVLGDGRFTFRSTYRDAAATYATQQAEAEAETQALILSLSLSFIVALLPLGYYYYQRVTATLKEKKRKAEASLKLKDTQELWNEMQKEQELARQLQREEEREQARLRREEREAAEQQNEHETDEQHADDNTNAAASPDGTKTQAITAVSSSSPPAESFASTAAPAQPTVDDDEDDRPSRSRDGGASATLHHCLLCRKKFKSVAQLENHLLSNLHKKAEKEANRGR